MHIDLRQLRHFIALIEHRSFVAAAAAVNLSQSAFSRSIQTLEHNVGCRLVDRASKELAPTRQGQLVLDHSRRLVHGARNLVNEINQFNGATTGTVRFGSGPAPAGGLVPRAVARFVSEFPAARTCFQVDNWQALNHRLMAEEIEFFVADTRQFEADPDYRVHLLTPQRWYFCCRVGHPLTQQEAVHARDLFDYPMATTLRPPNIRKVLSEMSERQDFVPSVECEHGYALLNVVMQSNTLGIACSANLQPYQAQGRLVALEPVDLTPEQRQACHTRYGIVSRVGYGLSPLAQGLVRQLIACDAEL
ncbi:LysR family transcriptional regulator [Pseudomonas sp. S75]|uniref:LysR family transcriptional regulator n=1 Tax=unclassified Pseudomonas TaxID=196821 RepID=UPI0019073F6F|nr:MULTISPECIES: LysR family transcriptional regulator [unclassified Pseudomonas]MBJ9977582.1 LysR family transcriptional regulator [Pseudomonas sp. S30]MBK0155246.1 LysR family transcriptional regulator [Pseudomonas sp. S75]